VHIQVHIHVTELLLFEVGLQESNTNFQSLQPTDRLEILWSLLGSLKSFLSLNFSCERGREPAFPCIFSIDFMYGFITCLKLISFQAPGWDSSCIRQDVDLVNLIDRQVLDLEDICVRRKLHKTAVLGQVISPTDQHPFDRVIEALKSVTASLKSMPDLVPMQITPAPQQTFTPPAEEETPNSQEEPEAASNTHFWQYLWKDVQEADAWNIDNSFPIGYPPGTQLVG
jgi:hypothetical protein